MLLIQRPEIKAHDEESGNKQRFSISPLEPGVGHTLGNSLRRTLLSSIPGVPDNAFVIDFDVTDKYPTSKKLQYPLLPHCHNMISPCRCTFEHNLLEGREIC